MYCVTYSKLWNYIGILANSLIASIDQWSGIRMTSYFKMAKRLHMAPKQWRSIYKNADTNPIKAMTCFPNSPDFNHIENVCNILKRNFDFRRVTNAIKLRKAIWECWCEIAPYYFENFIESTLRRISAVIRAIAGLTTVIIYSFWCSFGFSHLFSVYKLTSNAFSLLHIVVHYICTDVLLLTIIQFLCILCNENK